MTGHGKQQRICWYAIILMLCVGGSMASAATVTLSPGSTTAAPTISQGDSVFVRGVATGYPQAGLQVWLIGNNFLRISSIYPDTDNTYIYELNAADTRTLSPGQYFVLIQHPMMNGQFDITYNAATGEVSNLQLGTGGNTIFRMSGAGSLQSPDSANALMQAINDQNIDDTFATASFTIGVPTAFIDSIGDHAVGDRFTLTGSTNLAVGDKLMVEITSSSFNPTQKVQATDSSGASGMVMVEPGSGALNRWSFAVDTSTFKPDEYIVRVSGITQTVTGSATFSIVEKLPTTATPPAPVTMVQTVPFTTAATTILTPIQTTKKSPLSLVTIAGAIALAAAGTGIQKRR